MRYIYEVNLPTAVTSFSFERLDSLELDAAGETFVPDNRFHLAADVLVDIQGAKVTRDDDFRANNPDAVLLEIIHFLGVFDGYQILTNQQVYGGWLEDIEQRVIAESYGDDDEDDDEDY
jgi:hypothetical protein